MAGHSCPVRQGFQFQIDSQLSPLNWLSASLEFMPGYMNLLIKVICATAFVQYAGWC